MPQRHNARRTERPIARLLCCAALVLLPACQPQGPDAPFANYLSKLSAALKIAVPDLQTSAALTPPPANALQLDIPNSPVESLDFLQLSGCAVQANVGKRQISLGQHAKPSQRLLLELEYLRLAPACISRLRTGSLSGNSSGNTSSNTNGNHRALADMLEAAWQEKQAQLPALIFNATLGSDEYRAFWLALPAQGDYPRRGPDAVVAAMGAINNLSQRWLGGDYHADNRDFELLLSEVAGGDGGTQLQDWTQQIDWLIAGNRMLVLPMDSWCSGHARDTEVQWPIANYFSDTIHPLATQSQQRYALVATTVLALEAQLDAALPPHYRQWMEDRNRQVAVLTLTSAQHLERLKHLQGTCSTD